MTLPLLEAALIVKDEAADLPGCLAALDGLRPLLHRVVVLDTGSTDGTVELARAAGAHVIEGGWEGDFSRARNVALAAVPARWVLIVDADERVRADVGRLEAALDDALRHGGEAVVVPLVNLGPDGGELYAAPQIRIFRPDRAHYAGRLHERVEARRRGGRPLALASQPRDVVHVRHLGYAAPEVVAAKAARNLALVDEDLAAARVAPDDPLALARALYHRGRTLVTAGQVLTAVTDLEQLRALPPGPPVRVWGGDVLAQLLLALGRWDDLAEVIEQLRAEGVDGRWCDWLLAQSYLTRERFAEALPLLRGVDRLVDAVGRDHDLAPAVQAQLIAAGRVGEVDEAAACCIRLMAGMGRVDGLGPLLLTLWGARPAGWLAELLTGADAAGHLARVAEELRRCPAPGPEVAAALLPA